MLENMINSSFIKSMVFEPYVDNKTNLSNGVYRMFNMLGEIIYIGKSKDLQTRLNNHLAKRTHTAYFMDEVVRIDVHEEPVYETLLESMLIAYYKPKYNHEIKKGSDGNE